MDHHQEGERKESLVDKVKDKVGLHHKKEGE